MRRSPPRRDVLPVLVALYADTPPAVWAQAEAAARRLGARPEGERRALAAHVELARRLRARPDDVVAAVLDAGGRLVTTRPGSALGADVLFDGRHLVVPREDEAGRRAYLLVRNAPALVEATRLPPREAEVLRLSARGESGKAVALTLGVPASAVSTALARAAARLTLPSRAALIDVATGLLGGDDDGVCEPLSEAERAVHELLRRGLSNAEIARLRRRSPNTIANQVAAILRKSRRGSRRALRPRGDEPDSDGARSAQEAGMPGCRSPRRPEPPRCEAMRRHCATITMAAGASSVLAGGVTRRVGATSPERAASPSKASMPSNARR